MVDKTADKSPSHWSLAIAAALILAAAGCDWSPGGAKSKTPSAPLGPRRVVALGRIEPAGGVISISAIPGERLKGFAAGLVEGKTVAAGDELAQVASVDLRQTQLEAALVKLEMAGLQRVQEQAAAKAQLEQAIAAKAQAEAKLQEMIAQQDQLQNLGEAAAIAEEDYRRLASLQADDPELVTEHQLRRRRNASDRAVKEYQTAAAAYPHGLNAAKKGVEAAEASVKLARQNVELSEKVDSTLAIDMERRVAEEARDQSILRAPLVEGGSTEFTVLRTMMQPGEFVTQIPILEIGDLLRMACIAEVYEADAKELSVGQTAVIRSPAFSGAFADGNVGAGGGIKGKVTRIGTMIASPGLTNRNPLAPSDRSVVEVVVEIDPLDKTATAEAARRIGLQVTVEFQEAQAAGEGDDSSQSTVVEPAAS